MGVMPPRIAPVIRAEKEGNIQSRECMVQQLMGFAATTRIVAALARGKQAAFSVYNFVRVQSAVVAMLVFFARQGSRRNDVYNLLWAVVFGFATLNILSLAARRFEPNRRGLTFGELMAVLIVLLSIFLLGWELLGVFHIFPIKLQR